MLANEKYTGKLIWGKKTFERRPGSRQQVQRTVPRDEWRVQERPELRIVTDDLWSRVQARRDYPAGVADAARASAGTRAQCGAILSEPVRRLYEVRDVRRRDCDGCRRTRSPRYGCLRAWRNGPSACTNRLTIRAKLADAYLLDGLRAELLAPTTLDYITAQVRAALNARNTTRPQRLAEAQSARDATAQRLERLITAIEQGAPAAALTPRIIEQQAG